MKPRFIINKIKDNIFYLAWIMMEVYICIVNSSVKLPSLKFVSYFCVTLFLIKIIFTNYNIKELIKLMFIVFLCCLSTYFCGDSRVLWFGLVVCASKNIDFNKLVIISFITMFSCVIVFILLFLFNITDGSIIDYSKGRTYGLGLGHPNMFSAYYNLLIIHLVFLYYNKINFKHIILSTLGALIIYLLSKSVSGSIVYFCIACSLLVYNDNLFKDNSLKLFLKKLYPYLIVIGIIIFSIIPLIYTSNNCFLRYLDHFFTGRFSQANYYFDKYGVSFFGNKIFKDLNTSWLHAILDIGYTRMLIYNGIVYYLFVVVPLLLLIFKFYKENKYQLLIFVSSFAIYMFTENVSTYIFMNVSMILFSNYLFIKDGGNYEKK